mmetsp:Transcript_100726/g.285471  ORF Transcript_100726/g.285471 Transcript_100726/m.285471 type:complete len:200 (+) Transcript_100726:201-800(+)
MVVADVHDRAVHRDELPAQVEVEALVLVRGLVHERRDVPRPGRPVGDVRCLAKALAEGRFRSAEQLHGPLQNEPKVVADELLVAVGPPGLVLLGITAEALVRLLARRNQHEAAAEPVLRLWRAAGPVVPLPPHGLPLEEPVNAAEEDGVRVQPDELLKLRQAPDLQLPVGDSPSRHEAMLHARRQGHLMNRQRLHVQPP